MIRRWQQAIVVGAGMGGLLCARVLSDWCERVVVLERDSLPEDGEPRSGVPQGRHLHALLAGGCRAIEAMLPGTVEDMRRAGAIEVITGWDARLEVPGHDPLPRRDLGFSQYPMTRPAFELCLRRRVQAIPGVIIESKTAVEHLLHDATEVTGVQLRDGRTVRGELLVDASGRGELTRRLLDSMQLPQARQTVIGVDISYATALFERDETTTTDWKSVVMLPNAPEDSRCALLSPVEGGRWICAVGWRGEQQAPVDRDSYVEWARRLRTDTVYRALADAKMLGGVMRQVFRESCHRHYSQLETWPRGLLPVGDAICRFNPIYGQGMSVAALEAEALGELLAADSSVGLDELARRFLLRCDAIIEAPWSMAALPDFAYPHTRGDRPPELASSLQFNQAVTELAVRDASVHKLMMEIRGLLKPRSALTGDPELMQRILGVMTEKARSAAQADVA